jgi:ubiquinone biosynthesis protein
MRGRGGSRESADPPRYRSEPAASRGGPLTDLRRGTYLAAQIVRWLAYPALRRLLGRPLAIDDVAVRLRRLLESSGVTPVKLGQYLAIRLDLLPAEVCRELANLFDAVPPLPFPVIRGVIEAELGRPLESIYREFDPEPIAAASIAQVHRAHDDGGRAVAVKVQRPDVAAVLAADFRNLRRLARLADTLGWFGDISASGLIDEVAAFTFREVDFRQEGRTADRIRTDAADHVHVPWIDWSRSGRRVLTMEFIAGVPLARIINLAESGVRDAFRRSAPHSTPRDIVERLSRACLTQLFVTGVFQGDPHPANILVEPDGNIAFVDFGIFGELTAAERDLLADYVRNLAVGRLEAAFEDYAETIDPSAETDWPGYRSETLQIMAEWQRNAGTIELPPKLRLTARYQGQMFEAMRRHRVAMRREYLLFWRALAVLDSTAQRLPADFDLLATMRRFFIEHQPPMAQRLRDAATAVESPDTLLRIREMRGKLLSLWAQPAPLRLAAEFSSMPTQRRGASLVAKALALALAGVVAATLVLTSQGGSAGMAFGILSLAVLLAATRLADPH